MIETILQSVLGGILDTYPEVADVEDPNELKTPYAVYKVQASDVMTKESVKHNFGVGIFVVADGYDESQSIAERIRSRMYNLSSKENGIRSVSLVVSPVEYSTSYDQDDRKYIVEISFNIKIL